MRTVLLWGGVIVAVILIPLAIWLVRGNQHVIILYSSDVILGGTSVGIASLTGERVLVLKDHAEAWKARTAQAVTS